MTEIVPGKAYRSISEDCPIQGEFRILFESVDANKVVIIRIPICNKPKKKDDGDETASPEHNAPKKNKRARKKGIAYYPSPFCKERHEVYRWANEKLFVETAIPIHPVCYQSDEQLRQRYPPRRKKKPSPQPVHVDASGKRRRPRLQYQDTPSIEIRDRQYAWIKPLIEEIRSQPADVFLTNRIAEWIRRRVEETNARPTELRCALNKYLALAIGKNGLIPSDLATCGGKATPRSQENGKLGRKRAGVRSGLVLDAGIALSKLDKQRIAWGYKHYLSTGLSEREAYLLTMGAFWSNGTILHQGRLVPLLKPDSERPSRRQFNYWGPRGEDSLMAWQLQLRPGEWEKKFRDLYGTARDGVYAVGQVACGDSTSNDVCLVSAVSPLRAIGPATVLIFHDLFSDCIVGWYCGLEAPSELVSRLAIYNMISDSVEYCRRFGVDLKPGQIPSGFYRSVLVFNCVN